LHRELTAIYEGNFWKAASLYYRLRERFKPLRGLARIVRATLAALRPVPVRQPSTLAPIRIAGLPARSDGVGAIPEVTLAEKGKVSVILPVRGNTESLETAIQSILVQSYSDLEVIALLDPEAAGAHELLARYRTHPRVMVLEQRAPNLAAAINQAFRFAQGEFVTWVAPEDVLEELWLDAMVDALNRHPEVGLVYSDYQLIDDSARPLSKRIEGPASQDPQATRIVRLPHVISLESLLEEDVDLFGPSVLYRRSVIWAIGELAEDLGELAVYDYAVRTRHLFEVIHLSMHHFIHRSLVRVAVRESEFSRFAGRHKARNDFLASPVAVHAIGVDFKGLETMSEDRLVVCDYDHLDELPAMPSRYLLTCVLDMAHLARLESAKLGRADLIITIEPQVFCALEEEYAQRIFLLDLTRPADKSYFLKVAQNRLFDKEKGGNPEAGSPNTDLPRVSVRGPLKVAFQVESLDRGGLEEVVFQVISNLDRRSVEPVVLINHYLQGFLGHQLQESGVPVHLIKAQEGGLPGLLETEHFDVVSFHHSLFGVDAYKAVGVSTMYTFHTSYTWYSPEQTAERKAGFALVDRFTAVSSQVRDYSVHKFGIPYPRIQVIPNSLDTRVFPDEPTLRRADFGIRDDDFVFLHVGSFNGPKYHQIMLSALEHLLPQMPAIKLVFVGNILDKAYFAKIQERVAESCFGDRLLIFDYMTKAQLADLFRASNCFLLPSLQEGWSVAAMEAMYFGLPLILTDVGSARDIIVDEDIGIIIPNPYQDIRNLTLDDLLSGVNDKAPSNLPHLIEAMARIYREYPLWRQKGFLGTRKITARFAPDLMAKAYEEAFRETKGRYGKQPWRFIS